MEERRYYKAQRNSAEKAKYKEKDKEVRRQIVKAKNDWWREKCDELEEYEESGKIDRLYMEIRNLCGQNKQKLHYKITDKNGNLLVTSTDQQRWKEYIEDLYAETTTVDEIHEIEIDEASETNEIMKEEMTLAINRLPNNKAAGTDSVQAELIKALEANNKRVLVDLMKDTYDKKQWPKDFTTGILVSIPKKPMAAKCGVFRTINLLSYSSKVLIQVIKD